MVVSSGVDRCEPNVSRSGAVSRPGINMPSRGGRGGGSRGGRGAGASANGIGRIPHIRRNLNA